MQRKRKNKGGKKDGNDGKIEENVMREQPWNERKGNMMKQRKTTKDEIKREEKESDGRKWGTNRRYQHKRGDKYR